MKEKSIQYSLNKDNMEEWKSFNNLKDLNYHGVYFIIYSPRTTPKKFNFTLNIIYVGVSTKSLKGIEQRLRTFMNRTYKSKINRIKKEYKKIYLPHKFDKDQFYYSCYKFCNSKQKLKQLKAESLFCCELDGIMHCRNKTTSLLPIYNLVRQKTEK